MKFNLPLVLITSLVLIGCAPNILAKKSLSIKPGQTKDEVIAILGTPGNRQFQRNEEAWQYCTSGDNSNGYWVVWFVNERVSGLTTYSNSYYGDCNQYFRTINWEDAPDKSIEIRKR